MTSTPEHELLLELQDLIIATESVAGFLGGLSAIAANALSRTAGAEIECGVTLKRFKKTTTVGGSSPRAIRLDRIEQQVGDGPCILALKVQEPVLMDDARTDPRWPDYQKALIGEGCLSVLGVPLELNEDALAALNFFAPAPGLFTEETVNEALRFGDIAARAVRLAVRIGTAESAADDLAAALSSRTAINLACGIIMGQNRCSQAEAVAILVEVSSHRNKKLRDVAVEMVLKVSGEEPATHFEK